MRLSFWWVPLVTSVVLATGPASPRAEDATAITRQPTDSADSNDSRGERKEGPADETAAAEWRPMLVVTGNAQVRAKGKTGTRLPKGAVVQVSIQNGEWFLVPRWNQWIHESHVRTLPAAVEELGKQISTEPTAERHFLRGIAQLEQGRLQDAIDDFDQAIQLGLNSANVFLNRGLAWGRSNKRDEAIADFTEAIKRDRKSPLAHFNRGVLYWHGGQEAAALKDFNAAIELEDTYAEAYNNRGVLFQNRGDFQRALADFNAALKHRPRYPGALTNRAFIWQEQGEFAAALEDYAAALAIAPDSHATLNDLAWLLATCPDDTIRNGTFALQYAERACEITGQKVPDYLDTLAAAAAEAGQFQRAVQVLKSAIELSPGENGEELRERLALYEENRPYRESAPPQ